MTLMPELFGPRRPPGYWRLPTREYDPKQPRDPKGEWTKTPGGASGPLPMPYGDLHNEAPESGDVARHLEDLKKLPGYAASVLKNKGVTFYVSDKSMPDMDDMGKWKDVQPRGWPPGMTWNSVGGCYVTDSKYVLAGNRQFSGSVSLALHETGHALDQQLADGQSAISARPAMDAHHRRLYNRLGSYYTQDGPGGAAGKEEMFAEGVAHVLTDEAGARGAYDDEFVAWVKGVLDGSVDLWALN